MTVEEYEAWRRRVALALQNGLELDLEDRPAGFPETGKRGGNPDPQPSPAPKVTKKSDDLSPDSVPEPVQVEEEYVTKYVAKPRFASSSKITLDMMRTATKKPKRLIDRTIPHPKVLWDYDSRMSEEGNAFLNAAAECSSSSSTHSSMNWAPTVDTKSLPDAKSWHSVSGRSDVTYNYASNQYEQLDSVGPFKPVWGNSFHEERDRSSVRLHALQDEELVKKNVFTRESNRQVAEHRQQRVPRKPPWDHERGKRLYTKDDIPGLREQWYEKYSHIMQGVPETMPPFREVNHEIPIIDPEMRYSYHPPRCPHILRQELRDKVDKYVRAGWWNPAHAAQAAPMLCLLKRDKRLRTVVDCRQRNDNTVQDVTPMPDQEGIREDVARAKYRSKIDLSDAYEQIRIILEHVDRTAFSTIFGTYESTVMQQGDCNAPATFQRLMTALFRKYLGDFVHVYLDDIFIFSNSIEEHEEHLRIVFEVLEKNLLYLKKSKCELYADTVDCLGHKIDDAGIHPDIEKVEKIQEWRTPRTYNDIQRFVGLVQYLSGFIPDLSTYSGPLLSMTHNSNAFNWRPIHQRCFDMIKHICSKISVLKPLDYTSSEPIWVICDASQTGVGAMYGQGATWQTCRPAGFMSKKFSSAQQHYRVFEQETLAILEALSKWEDKLIGHEIHIITDHQALEFFQTQANLSPRQWRWMDYMSRFDLDITYVKGEHNKVADCLSRYFESDRADEQPSAEFHVNIDTKLDKDGDDLPIERLRELQDGKHLLFAVREENGRRSRRLQEKKEIRDIEAQELLDAQPRAHDSLDTEMASVRAGSRRPSKISKAEATVAQDTEYNLGDALGKGPDSDRPTPMPDNGFEQAIRSAMTADRLGKALTDHPEAHPAFKLRNGIAWTQTTDSGEAVYVPEGVYGDQKLRGAIIERAHAILGHFGHQRTVEYIRHHYWWPRMVTEVRKFCSSCEDCARAKGSNQRPAGKLHSLPIPTKPWESIGMDFIGPFPEVERRGTKYNYLWVVICRMTGMAHLIPVHTTMSASELAWVYRREIVRLHGLPSSIVSDRDSKFTSKWWRELHRIMGTRLLMSTSFHPQTDGQTERMNRSVGQVLRIMVRPDQLDWLNRIDMGEFAINASVSVTTGYAPFEIVQGRIPAMIHEIVNPESAPPAVRDFAQAALEHLQEAHDAIIEARVFQATNANKLRRDEPQIAKGDLVYLSTANLNLPKGRASKLCPKYIGPYRVVEAEASTSNYTLELPTALTKRRIHPKFHVSLLKPFVPNDDLLFPNRATPEPYDFGAADDTEWFVDEVVGHEWKGKKLQLQVRWSLGDTTWEKYGPEIEELEAFEHYLELFGIDKAADLPRKKPSG